MRHKIFVPLNMLLFPYSIPTLYNDCNVFFVSVWRKAYGQFVAKLIVDIIKSAGKTIEFAPSIQPELKTLRNKKDF